jgi:hypothetical protein
MRRLIIACALGLTACAAPRYGWELPGQSAAATERQRETDSAECLALAVRFTSLPAEAVQAKVAVDFRGLDRSESGDPEKPTGTGSEIETQRIRAAALKEADIERQAISDACMLHRGWVKRAG